jgi:hypothetical protein
MRTSAEQGFFPQQLQVLVLPLDGFPIGRHIPLFLLPQSGVGRFARVVQKPACTLTCW